jgi:hypothetical protein
MGLYRNGQKIAGPYLNGQNNNAYLNGHKIFASEPLPVKSFGIIFETPISSITFYVNWTPKDYANCLYSVNNKNWKALATGVKTITFDNPTTTFYMRGDWRTTAGTLQMLFRTMLLETNYFKFAPNNNIVDIMGGQPLPTVANMFYDTFNGCRGLEEINFDLFRDISGPPQQQLFRGTFQSCAALTELPSFLFETINGAPAIGVFRDTFGGCYGINKPLPDGLFRNIQGDVAVNMFADTFYYCNNIPGSIPSDFFGNLTGKAVGGMFHQTFFYCANIKSISNAFSKCHFTSSAVNTMTLYETFYLSPADASRTGASPADANGVKAYNWDTGAMGLETFKGNTGLSDYSSIPSNRK